MATNAVLYFPEPAAGITITGEGGQGNPNAIQLAEEWSFSVENKLNIGPQTMGAGSGRAEFQDFTVKKQVDKASPSLYAASCRLCHFNNVQLICMKSTGMQGTQVNSYLQWTFNMFAIAKIEWSNGEMAPEETVTFRFGTCEISYSIQNSSTGMLTPAGKFIWNQINGNDSPSITQGDSM